PKKDKKSPPNTINSVLPDNKTPPKSKQQIDKEHYQKNKERKKQQQCAEDIKEGFGSVEAVMKLEQKARIENNYLDTAEQLEKQSQEYLKDIELAKYHEERGKKGCECYSCEEQKKARAEVEAEREKIIADYEAEQEKSGDYETETIRGECGNCSEYKKVDSDSGL
ncbi:4690_t:CDS:2, partial [Scutellospora calospora]